ncbi:MAG: HAMP domain-containing histidine kinase [Clostridiales bacterium]|nr:HAMP domain-containing histidine kinase [Clostridiales bacterium]
MNIIKKTQYKFIAITLSAISIILILILGVLNICVIAVSLYNASMTLEQIEERRGFVFSSNGIDDNDSSIFSGAFSGSFGGLTDGSGTKPYMYVKINANNTYSPMITTNMSDTYSSDEIFTIAINIIDTGREYGIYNNMIYKVTSDDLTTTVTILDMSSDLVFMGHMLRLSIIVIICSLVVVFVFTYFLSKWAIKPVKEAFENQKRFISDASHELKTPLTVISANADVLESEIGDNKWLTNIKSQSELMSGLVYDLLDLTKLDETKDTMVMSEFDLSSLVLNKTLVFECTAFESGKNLEENIKEGITFKGDESSIQHLVSILIDNAIKHSDENGTIRVTLTESGSKKIFQVYNTGNGIRNDEKDKIFNRFYRSDQSRSRETGGYGLGLSIAKSIADANHGTISVDGEEGKWVSFTVVL